MPYKNNNNNNNKMVKKSVISFLSFMARRRIERMETFNLENVMKISLKKLCLKIALKRRTHRKRKNNVMEEFKSECSN